MSVWRERLLVLLVIAVGATVLAALGPGSAREVASPTVAETCGDDTAVPITAAATLRSMERAGVSRIRLNRCSGSDEQNAQGTAREGRGARVDVICLTRPYALWREDAPQVTRGAPDDADGFGVRFANVECSVWTTAEPSQVTERLAAALASAT